MTKIALLPDANHKTRGMNDEGARRFVEAIRESGAELVSVEQATGLIWIDTTAAETLMKVLDNNPQIEWVQLPWAGVENFNASGIFERPIKFTSAKGLYGEQVGEHALMLTLACLRSVTAFARTKAWRQIEPESLFRKRVTVLGAGGLGQTYIDLIQPFGCEITVLRRNNIHTLHDVLPQTDVLVVALPLIPETTDIIDEKALALMPANAVVINIGRGKLINTDALVAALSSGQIAAAGLDVTDPEPLPEGHPLWDLDNVLITSHCGDSDEFVTERLAQRITQNLKNFSNNRPLEGVVDAAGGH